MKKWFLNKNKNFKKAIVLLLYIISIITAISIFFVKHEILFIFLYVATVCSLFFAILFSVWLCKDNQKIEDASTNANTNNNAKQNQNKSTPENTPTDKIKSNSNRIDIQAIKNKEKEREQRRIEKEQELEKIKQAKTKEREKERAKQAKENEKLKIEREKIREKEKLEKEKELEKLKQEREKEREKLRLELEKEREKEKLKLKNEKLKARKALKKEKLQIQKYGILQMNEEGKLISQFNSLNEAIDATGVNSKSIRDCCNGIQKSAGGFVWKYADDKKRLELKAIREKRKQEREALQREKLPKEAQAENQKPKLIQMDNDGAILNQFTTLNEAVTKTGVNSKSIRDCCKGIQKSAGGYIWKYAENAEQPDAKLVEEGEKAKQDNAKFKSNLQNQKPKLLQLNDEGIIINQYYTLSEAIIKTGINSKSIRNCCNGIQKHAGGYVWKYTDNENFE